MAFEESTIRLIRRSAEMGSVVAVVMVVVQELSQGGREEHRGAAAVVLWVWWRWRRRGGGERGGSERERGRFGSVSVTRTSGECAVRAGCVQAWWRAGAAASSALVRRSRWLAVVVQVRGGVVVSGSVVRARWARQERWSEL